MSRNCLREARHKEGRKLRDATLAMEWISWVLFRFDGRINRITWLYFFVGLAAAEAVSGMLLREMVGMPVAAAAGSAEEFLGDRAALVAELMFLWPSAAVDVKRWHDLGKSGWLALAAYGPVTAMYLVEGLKEAGAIAAVPVPGLAISTLGLIFLVYFVLLAAGKGASGANRFGEATS
jgi:uncharacterized membrane protein YhaH (DUF805 family)